MAPLIEELVGQGRYAAINIYALAQDEVRWLIAHLRTVVPQEQGRFLGATEIMDPSLKQAAALLANDELHALAENDVPSPQEQWDATLAEIDRTLAPYADDTAPVPDASPPADHVAAIRALLDDIAHDLRFCQADADTPEEAERLSEIHYRSMLAGFHIGQHAQLTLRAPFLRAYAGEIQPVLDARLAAQQALLQRDEAQARNALLSGVQDKVEVVRLQRHSGQIGNAMRAHAWQRLAETLTEGAVSGYVARSEDLIATGKPVVVLLKKQLLALVTAGIQAHFRHSDPLSPAAQIAEETVRPYLNKHVLAYRELDQTTAALKKRAADRKAALAKARVTFRAPKF